MPDRPPLQRYRIVERGGRLEVIDLTTGARPPSAAERMAAHDAEHGYQALRYDRSVESDREPQGSTVAEAAAPALRATPADLPRAAPPQQPSPWQNRGGTKRPQLAAQSNSEAEARPGPMAKSRDIRPAPQHQKGRQTIVTGKWWDAKGPRTITLGDAGRAKLGNGFVTVLIIGFFVLMALLIIQPILLLVAGFVLFRFGGTILAPIGAKIVDQAVSADGGR